MYWLRSFLVGCRRLSLVLVLHQWLGLVVILAHRFLIGGGWSWIGGTLTVASWISPLTWGTMVVVPLTLVVVPWIWWALVVVPLTRWVSVRRCLAWWSIVMVSRVGWSWIIEGLVVRTLIGRVGCSATRLTTLPTEVHH